MTDPIFLTPNADASYTLPDGSKLVPTMQLVPAAPPPPPVSPPPPLVPAVAKFSFKVDGLNVTFTDESTGDVMSVQYDPGNQGTPKPCPVGGSATFYNYKPGTYRVIWVATGKDGKVSKASASVTVTDPVAEKPVEPPAAPPAPPKAAINVTVDGATVTVHDQTTGATNESIDFGDGTVMDDKPQ